MRFRSDPDRTIQATQFLKFRCSKFHRFSTSSLNQSTTHILRQQQPERQPYLIKKQDNRPHRNSLSLELCLA